MQCAFYLKHQDLCAGKRNAYLTIFVVDNPIVHVSKGYQQMHLFSVFVTFCDSHDAYSTDPTDSIFFFHRKKACSEWLSKSLNFLFVNFIPFFFSTISITYLIQNHHYISVKYFHQNAYLHFIVVLILHLFYFSSSSVVANAV